MKHYLEKKFKAFDNNYDISHIEQSRYFWHNRLHTLLKTKAKENYVMDIIVVNIAQYLCMRRYCW